MKVNTISGILLIFLFYNSVGQPLELTFTAIDSTTYVQLDSIKVYNRTLGGDTTLYWPDTVLIMDYMISVSEKSIQESNLKVYQNYPNPVTDLTTIETFIPAKGKVRMIISDILGRKIIDSEFILEKGYHKFSFRPENHQIYFLSVQFKNHIESIKIISCKNESSPPSLNYIGGIKRPKFKSGNLKLNNSFDKGVKLLFVGYQNGVQSGIQDTFKINKTYTFQFAHNIPCIGNPIVFYGGKEYNTIQVYSQCWFKENLDFGTLINGDKPMTDNDTIEKYCYDNIDSNCTKYGGLYLWNEIMDYTTVHGAQGICPNDWHIPTNDEWKILEGAVDSQFNIGDSIWDDPGYRGYDVGNVLKSQNEWNAGSGIDLFFFSALPAGKRNMNKEFQYLHYDTYFWTSELFDWWGPDNHAIFRRLRWNTIQSGHAADGVNRPAYSVRCIKN